MNTALTWHLEMIDWNAINSNKYVGDIVCNTTVENFFTLADVWNFLGFRLKRERCGYSGIINNIEYRLTRI